MTVLNRKLITRMVNPQPGGNGGGGGSVPSSQAVNWTDIDGKPTTLAGYGITDAKWADQTQTSDRRNLTIGSVTQQVITAHQSLYGYATELWVAQRGYATQSWVNQNFITVEWFDKLFKLYNGAESDANKIAPNGTLPSDPANLNIEAMFGFWTKKYISALGQGDDGTSYTTLAQLNDVTLTNPTANQVLTYNGTHWVNAAAPSSASALDGLTDVALSSLADKDLLQWDYTTGKWKNVVISTAMSGYATTSQLANYLPLSGGTISGGINPNADSTINLGTATAKYHYIYAHRLVRLQSIAKGDTYDSYQLTLPDKSGTIAVTSDIPTNNNQLTNGAGYVTSSGVTSVATGTGLTGGTITGTGTISINSTYQTYISHGESAYGWGNHANAGYASASSLSNYLPLSGGTITGTIYANTGSGLVVASKSKNKPFVQGIRVIGSVDTDYWTVISLQDSTTSNLVALVYNTSSLAANLQQLRNGVSKSLNIPYEDGIILHTGANDLSSISGGNVFSVTNNEAYIGFDYKCEDGVIWSLGSSSASNGIFTLWNSYSQNRDFVFTKTGRFGIGVLSPSYELQVNGNIAAGASNGNFVQIGNIRMMYDSTNNAIKVVKSDGTAANFYATGGLSALGVGQESGGGGDVTWALLATQATNGRTIHQSYISGALSNYLPLTGGTLHSTNNDVIKLTSDSSSNCGLFFDRSTTGWGIGALTTGYFYFWNNAKNDMAVQISSNGDVYAASYNNTSDIRKKNVIKNVSLRLDQIAKAPAFEYYWLDTSIDHDLHVGTSAQYWENVLPQVVTTAKDEIGTKSLQYGVAALISAITVARKVMTHEEKIALLETRVSALEKENGDQEQLINSLQEELAKFKAA